ncbi:glycoside hydrolase family 73 protein [Alkalibacterium sp.]|nr:MAG: N-acetylmuramidase [Alkalibacterium sp.]
MAKRKKKAKGLSFIKRSMVVLLAFAGTILLLGHSVEQERSEREAEFNDRQSFIDAVATYAVPLQETHGIKPSIAIAQAIVESNWGKSGLSVRENNYFGIKGSASEPSYATLEYDDEWIEIRASFRTYSSMEESVTDYANLLAGGTDWNPNLYQPVIEAEDYKEAAHALKSAGYATDPSYPEKLIDIVEQYSLYEYDN